MLVAVQVTLAVLLVIGAGLFVRSLQKVYAVDPGVDMEPVTIATLNWRSGTLKRSERELVYQQARARLAALPFVQLVALVHFHPFPRGSMSIDFKAPNGVALDFQEGPHPNLAGPGYFATAGTRIIQGREFQDDDGPGGAPVAIVNQEMARALAPEGRALGECVAIGDQVEKGGCTRIIGIVENTRQRFLDAEPVPYIYLSRLRDPAAISWGGPALVIRTRDRADQHTAQLRSVLQGMRMDLPYVNVQPLTELIRREVLPYRLGATLFSMFGILAAALSAIGLAGVLGYFVSERTPEIGIRRAVGGPARSVVYLVVRQALLPVCLGVGAGLIGALGGFRFINSLLFGISAHDPVAFAGAIVFLIAVAVVAILIPATRAARVDPMFALRHE
jgi:predicted permease